MLSFSTRAHILAIDFTLLYFDKLTKQSLRSGLGSILGLLSPLLVSSRALLQSARALFVYLLLSQLLVPIPGCKGTTINCYHCHKPASELRAVGPRTLSLLLLLMDPPSKIQGLRDGSLLFNFLQALLQFQFVLEHRLSVQLLLSLPLYPFNEILLLQLRLLLPVPRYSLLFLPAFPLREFVRFLSAPSVLVLPANPLGVSDPPVRSARCQIADTRAI